MVLGRHLTAEEGATIAPTHPLPSDKGHYLLPSDLIRHMFEADEEFQEAAVKGSCSNCGRRSFERTEVNGLLNEIVFSFDGSQLVSRASNLGALRFFPGLTNEEKLQSPGNVVTVFRAWGGDSTKNVPLLSPVLQDIEALERNGISLSHGTLYLNR